CSILLELIWRHQEIGSEFVAPFFGGIFSVLVADARLSYEKVRIFMKKGECTSGPFGILTINDRGRNSPLIEYREAATKVLRPQIDDLYEHTRALNLMTPIPESLRRCGPAHLHI